MAAEALALHIAGVLAARETLPKPSTLEAVMRERLNRGAVGVLVDAPGVASGGATHTKPWTG